MTQTTYLLGIVGDSAAGKSTITTRAGNCLAPSASRTSAPTTIISMTARSGKQLNITALHPDCNYLDILELHLERMHYGQPILKPVYDHRRARWCGPIMSSRWSL